MAGFVQHRCGLSQQHSGLAWRHGVLQQRHILSRHQSRKKSFRGLICELDHYRPSCWPVDRH